MRVYDEANGPLSENPKILGEFRGNKTDPKEINQFMKSFKKKKRGGAPSIWPYRYALL